MKTAIVTGSNRGIGLETTLALARQGFFVYATTRDPQVKSQELKSIVESENLPVSIKELDVNSDKSVHQCMSSILQDGRPIDVLVNNAGIERRGSVEELDIDVFRLVMETNCFGVIRCIQHIVPGMRERKTGCIINVASVAGKLANPPFAPYNASKFALEAVSECLAQEVKPYNVRVAIVEPGIIDTDMARDIEKEPGDSIYPGMRRMASLFKASLQTPTSPGMVADKIVDIAQGDSWQLRYPVGPDAAPFIDWRKSMTDEEWVDWNSADDETWKAAVKRDFGLDVT